MPPPPPRDLKVPTIPPSGSRSSGFNQHRSIIGLEMQYLSPLAGAAAPVGAVPEHALSFEQPHATY